MSNFEHIHDTARKLMKKEDVFIFLADRDIELLTPTEEELKEPTLPIWNPDKVKGSKIRATIVKLTYNELLNKGLVVVARRPEIQWYKGQRYQYYIVYSLFSSFFDKTVKKLPEGMTIEYDLHAGAVRLVGKSAGEGGYGIWIPVLE